MKKSSVIIIAVIVILAGWFIVQYNSLVTEDEQVKNKWNEVQNSYQRRMDLVPSLVNVVKGLTNYEQTTLVEVTEARSKAASVNVTNISADAYNQQAAAQDALAASSNKLLVTVEKYPELKGTAAFKGLQVQLEGTERRIKFARKDFNAAVNEYNSSVRSFPTDIVAGITGFHSEDGFQADAGTDKSVEIKF
ncbi:MAG TPA: LemA family protein [Ferruginibacter sp.]|jgi:LemA protein|nr:LemA family protein [Ferruginibacter sp.]